MEKKTVKILKSLASVALAVALCLYAFKGISWTEFRQGLEGARWSFVLLSMLCGVLAFAIRGLRWKQLLSPLGEDCSFLHCFGTINLGNISNLVIPYSGEVVRCALISRRSRGRITFDKTLGTIVLERAWDMLSIIVILAMILLLKWNEFGNYFHNTIWMPLSRRLDSGVWLLAVVAVAAACASIIIIWRFRERNSVAGRIYGLFRGVLDGFASCLRMKRKGLFLIYTALIWAMYWLQIVFCVNTLNLSLGLSDALFLMAVGSIASFVPVPGGFGAYHYLIAMALTRLYGLDWQSGILFATLVHESQAVTMILSGIASLGATRQ